MKKAEQVVLVDDDYDFDGGIVLEPCFGHSAGHVVVNIADQGVHGVVTGDVIHHQIQLRFPSMSTKADTDPDVARKTRTALIEKLAGTKLNDAQSMDQPNGTAIVRSHCGIQSL